MKIALTIFFLTTATTTTAWMPVTTSRRDGPTTALSAQVGIFYGTSTGSTMTAAEAIYEAFGSDVAAEPVDIETLEPGQVAAAFGAHDALGTCVIL